MQVLCPEDLYKFRNPGDPRLSCDGSRVVYVVSQADKKSDRNLTSIWIVPASGGKPVRLTNSGRDRFPRWSPDGSRIAFVSDRSGKPQIWILNASGGEAWHVQTEEAVRGAPVWSPDGKSIAFAGRDFSKPDDWTPYPGAPSWDRDRAVAQSKQALSGKAPKDEEPKVSDVKVINRFRYRFDGVGYLGDLRGHIFLVDVPESPGDSAEVKASARRITSGDYDHNSPSFSPDGQYVALSAVRRDDADYLQKSDLWLVHIATSRMVQLLEGTGPCDQPTWSPDGTKVAFVGHDRSHGGSTTVSLWYLDVSGFMRDLQAGASAPAPLTQKDAKNLTLAKDRPVGNPVSSDMRLDGGLSFDWVDAGTLMLLICDEGATGLYTVSACGSPDVKKVFHDPGKCVAAFDRRGETIVVQAGSPERPDELFALERCGSGNSLRPLTRNSAWLDEYGIGASERITYKGDKGWYIDGWLLYPAGYEKGKTYPTVLFIHGGPHGVYGSSFMFQCQIFASKGYAVLYTDPRGSQAWGQRFAEACVEDWGGSDHRDIQAGVDEAVARGVADQNRLCVTGWSYGGYMTSWTITQTNRFKAAVAGAVVTDRYSMYGTSDIPFFNEYEVGGLPWEARDKYFSRSAISFVKNVQTPVLFIHGEGDLRCPISQSEEYYLSLKRLGKTAVMARYPGEFHGFTRPSHKFDRFERMIAWFDHYGRKTE